MAAGSSVNAGVHASAGFDFQKHCALYLWLENYNTLKSTSYSIYLEHHDDILFCHLTKNEVTRIDAYQAKKASVAWGCSVELYDIIKKMTENGILLIRDPITKTSTYNHKLHFITNSAIKLIFKQKPKNVTTTVNESNQLVDYPNLPTEIQTLLSTELSKLTSDPNQLAELSNTAFRYIDFAKTTAAQREQIIGAFNTVFGNSVRDHAAAVDLLLKLFKRIETTLNQGGIARLTDNRKRVDSSEINDVVNVITNRQKAFDLWRSEKKNICSKLNIPLLEQTPFELDFENSFDLFKDLTQAEHRKIIDFVLSNKTILNRHTDDVECLYELLTKFDSEKTSQLNENQKKAALFAAYIEIKS